MFGGMNLGQAKTSESGAAPNIFAQLNVGSSIGSSGPSHTAAVGSYHQLSLQASICLEHPQVRVVFVLPRIPTKPMGLVNSTGLREHQPIQ